jgi:glycosyltransferase involved in cell wall biosynthesis
MKIFYFSGATLPSDSAQSVHVMKMCSALAGAAKDNAVTLFAKGGDGVTDEDIFRYYGVDQNFSLVLSANPKVRIVTGLLRMLGHGWALREYGLPDLAYGRDVVELDCLVPPEVPVVFEAHQMPVSYMQKRALKNMVKRKEFKMVAISEMLKKDLLKAYPKLKKDRIFVAPDGADVLKNEPVTRELAGRPDVLKVGYTGSLHEGKGMEVIAVVAREAKDFDFHVVGGSTAQVGGWKKLKLPENIFLHGHVPHGELAGWLAAFDILIAPYRINARIKTGADIARWISPMKIFEYMAAGKPIVCSDLPVIREVLHDNENALMVAPSDLKGWVAALERLGADEGLRERLTGAAFRDLEQKYTWRQRARNILKFVEKGI